MNPTDRPRRWCRPTLLIVGCGDVGMRVARLLRGRWRLLALSSTPARREALRGAGIVPLAGDLDRPETLARLAGLADAVLHLAPPAASGPEDGRTARLIEALARSPRLTRLVYGSTSGVYGDCRGERVEETRPPAPATDRARRRVDAEQRLRQFGRRSGVIVTVLRIPASMRSTGPAAIRANGWAGARRSSPPATTSGPTTSMPTTWRAPASPPCIAAGRSASSTPATTAS
jgi:nucleoside-diphosphate-sugar epimerase